MKKPILTLVAALGLLGGSVVSAQQNTGTTGDTSEQNQGQNQTSSGGQEKGGQEKGGQEKGGQEKGGQEKGGQEKGGQEKGGQEKGGQEK